MNFKELSEKLVRVLREYQNLLIYIKGSPDPDAIGSSFALKIICDKLDIKSSILATIEPSLPQNRALIEKLNIPVNFISKFEDSDPWDSYAILDHQSVHLENITGKIPCAVQIDHHESVEEKEPIGLKITSEKVGATSTIMALILGEIELVLTEKERKRVTTALQYGIQTDTNHFVHATDLDYDALKYLSLFSDNNILQEILGIKLPEKAIKLFGRAIKSKHIYKEWLIAGIGFVDESLRDSIALIADFLLEKEKVSAVIVFAAIEKDHRKKLTLDASVRTRDDGFNLDDLIKHISPDGGARRYKGAFQVNLDYFTSCPDRKLLWDVINQTTTATIKKQRDTLPIMELKTSFTKIRNKFLGLFKTEE